MGKDSTSFQAAAIASSLSLILSSWFDLAHSASDLFKLKTLLHFSLSFFNLATGNNVKRKKKNLSFILHWNCVFNLAAKLTQDVRGGRD